MKVWHHFICAWLAPITNHFEVTKDRAFLLYGIAKNLSINVSQWIEGNIKHAAENTSLGIPHLTLIMELIVANGLDTTGDKVLQPKGTLNFMAIIGIQQAQGGNSAAIVSSSGI